MGLNDRLARAARITRTRTRLALALLALALCAAAIDSLRLRRAIGLDREARQLAAQVNPPPPELPPDAPAVLRLARAHALAAADQHDKALAALQPLHGDDPLGQAARYDSANVLMRQALALRESAAPGQAIPLFELAKALYREVLRHDPGHWNARYNLERAQRALPDPDPAGAEAAELPRARERAAATVRGVAQGMP